MVSQKRTFRLLALALAIVPAQASAGDEYGFDLDEFEKKDKAWGGYAEFKWDRSDINQDGALSALNFYKDPRSSLESLSSTLQLNGSYSRGVTTFNWLVQATGSQDDLGWTDKADIFEGYASIKATPNLNMDIGKKVFKWGKGYAWNPVGFIDRVKDPNNPEEALEGYIGAGLDLVKSYDGALQTVALTTVALPAWRGVNEDFGVQDNVNLAAKLYLLYRDTDIDFLWYTGNSRSTRYGVDFSRNLASNLEVHGELAHVPNQTYKVLDESGQLTARETSDTSYLLGLRYLTENDLTAIVEFYHNDDGYTEGEMERFFQKVDTGSYQFVTTGDDTLLGQVAVISESGYTKPQPGRDYLYTRVTQKEPWDILYFTPGVTIILNLDDESYSLSPEMLYTGFTNWEMRLRFSYLNGGRMSEYGEKQNSNKVEVRLRYFF
ncbi:MAG: hypothetical protein FP813_06850 [Desulfurivibrio sp.]|nr:hypothetical protein [Desulfurivibrio sp.]